MVYLYGKKEVVDFLIHGYSKRIELVDRDSQQDEDEGEKSN